MRGRNWKLGSVAKEGRTKRLETNVEGRGGFGGAHACREARRLAAVVAVGRRVVSHGTERSCVKARVHDASLLSPHHHTPTQHVPAGNDLLAAGLEMASRASARCSSRRGCAGTHRVELQRAVGLVVAAAVRQTRESARPCNKLSTRLSHAPNADAVRVGLDDLHVVVVAEADGAGRVALAVEAAGRAVVLASAVVGLQARALRKRHQHGDKHGEHGAARTALALMQPVSCTWRPPDLPRALETNGPLVKNLAGTLGEEGQRGTRRGCRVRRLTLPWLLS